MIRKLLVPVRGDGMGEAVISHAVSVAKRHKAHIVVAHCRASVDDLMPYNVGLPPFARATIVDQARKFADEQETEFREELHRIAATHDLEETQEVVSDAASIEFVEERARMADLIKHNGRLADLIVVAQPDRDRNIGTSSLKAGLFQTGRPVLMCPPNSNASPHLGSRLAIAWNGSLEASRAVASTLDLAAAAETVTILAGGKGEPHGASAEELLGYYRLRGIEADIHRFEDRNPGEALLTETSSVGADLLIMGAYGHSHEREMLFGGNTQAVVDKAKLPVVLVH